MHRYASSRGNSSIHAGRWASAAPINGGLDDESALAAAIAASTAAPAEASPQGPRRRRQRGGREVVNHSQQQQQQQRRVRRWYEANSNGGGRYEEAAATAVPSSQEDWHTAQRAAGSLAEALPSLLFLALVMWAEVPLLSFSMRSAALFVFLRAWDVPKAVVLTSLAWKFACWPWLRRASEQRHAHDLRRALEQHAQGSQSCDGEECDEQDDFFDDSPGTLPSLSGVGLVDAAGNASVWVLSESTVAKLAAAQGWLQWLCDDAFCWSSSSDTSISAASGGSAVASDGDGNLSALADPPAAPAGWRRLAPTAGVESSAGRFGTWCAHLLAVLGRSPSQVRQAFWEDHPPGSFLHDHWVASLLSAIVLSISLASVMYSLAHSRFWVARLLRRLAVALWRPIWATRHHLRACVLAGFALLVLEEAGVWQAERHFGRAYLLGYGAAVLFIAMLDAVSDAMGRASTFTPERVRILLVSVFAIGLPIPFFQVEGRGWRVLSPLCFGLGLDGLGQAFLAPVLRTVAYWPVQQLQRLLELLERWVVRLCQALWQFADLEGRSMTLMLGAAAAVAIGAPHLQECRGSAAANFVRVDFRLSVDDVLHCLVCLGWALYGVICILCSLRGAEMLAQTLPIMRSCYSSSIAAVVWCGLRISRFLRPLVSLAADGLSWLCKRTADTLHWLCDRITEMMTWVYTASIRPIAHALDRFIRSSYAHLCSALSWLYRRAVDTLSWLYGVLTWIYNNMIRPVVHALDRFIRSVYADLCWLASASLRQATAVWRLWRLCLAELCRLATQLWHLLWAVLCRAATWLQECMIDAGLRLYHFLYFPCRWLWRRADDLAHTVARGVRALWSGVSAVCSTVLALAVRVEAYIHRLVLDTVLAVLRRLWRWLCSALHFLVHRILSRFSRAWWRLLPAALAVQTWMRFGLALFRATPPPAASAALGFVLASWAVLVISLVLIKDVYYRTFHWGDVTNRQYIATDPSSAFYSPNSRIDSLLQHVDLGGVAATRWICRNLGRVLSTVLRQCVRWGTIVLRRGLALLWDLVAQLLWQRLALPLLRGMKAVVLVIWNSPLLCSASTLAAMCLLWAHHSGRWRWTRLEWLLFQSQGLALELAADLLSRGMSLGRLVLGVGWRWLQIGSGAAWAVYKSTHAQLVAAAEAGEVESPRLAWVVWLVIVAATKSQPEIRIKTLSWPFLVLWLTAMAGGAQQLTWVLLGVLTWVGLGALVRRYEHEQHARVGELLNQRLVQARRHRGGGGRGGGGGVAAAHVRRPAGPPRAVVFTEQT
eukprot:COSAG01_NODE_2680_length_7260_cov_8.523397_1_plen_1280_part_10